MNNAFDLLKANIKMCLLGKVNTPTPASEITKSLALALPDFSTSMQLQILNLILSCIIVAAERFDSVKNKENMYESLATYIDFLKKEHADSSPFYSNLDTTAFSKFIDCSTHLSSSLRTQLAEKLKDNQKRSEELQGNNWYSDITLIHQFLFEHSDSGELFPTPFNIPELYNNSVFRWPAEIQTSEDGQIFRRRMFLELFLKLRPKELPISMQLLRKSISLHFRISQDKHPKIKINLKRLIKEAIKGGAPFYDLTINRARRFASQDRAMERFMWHPRDWPLYEAFKSSSFIRLMINAKIKILLKLTDQKKIDQEFHDFKYALETINKLPPEKVLDSFFKSSNNRDIAQVLMFIGVPKLLSIGIPENIPKSKVLEHLHENLVIFKNYNKKMLPVDVIQLILRDFLLNKNWDFEALIEFSKKPSERKHTKIKGEVPRKTTTQQQEKKEDEELEGIQGGGTTPTFYYCIHRRA